MTRESANWLEQLPAAPKLIEPLTWAEWLEDRKAIRAQLHELLGDIPPRPRKLTVATQKEDRGDYTLEKFSFNSGAPTPVFGYLLLPKKTEKVPAILYNHWHGGDYHVGKEELFRSDHLPEAPGPALVRRGFAVLCIDAPCFGARNKLGPSGGVETGQAVEWAEAKLHFWCGRTLWGMLLRDDLCALDYLCSRPEIDANRISTMGMSMGATRAWWLMGLDDRLRAGVAIACLTRYRELIAAGGLNQHGIYYYVPGMLKHFDAEAVLACIAPRPVLFLNGDRDPGSPIEGIRALENLAAPFWRLGKKPQNFRSIIEPNTAHECTERMWLEALGFLDRSA